MRAQTPRADVTILERQIACLPEMDRLRAADETLSAATPDLIAAVLEEAARFAHEQLDPLNAIGDREGCRIEEGRVKTPSRHGEVWTAFAQGGWTSIDLPEVHGGQGLPLLLALAAQEIFDRSCPAFGMLVVPARSAVRLIEAYGDETVRSNWVPHLIAGTWAATICISEPGAGSDVQRVRTIARQDDAGNWTVSGEKCWISFGDHDLSNRIGHCVLARTQGAKGLSLFLVPDHIDGVRNGVAARRLEEKLGLHLSPTCALGFEDSTAWLLGEEGRGLAQMFVMITNMRLSVGAMGLGIAAGAADVARSYAQERKQGGPVNASPVVIGDHPDVQRQLLKMTADVDLLRGLLYTIAAHADLSRVDKDAPLRAASADLVGWLLPIVKTLGGEIAFNVSSDAIQVLGGAGYTKEWPVEQALRDARVLAVFEGTTGMQGLDLLHRRLWRDGGSGLKIFTDLARKDMEKCGSGAAEALEALAVLEQAAAALMAMRDRSAAAEAGATPFLALASELALGWIAARNVVIHGDDPASARLRSTAGFFLRGIATRARALHNDATRGETLSDAYADIRWAN